jgi:mono/diheme cytochrome c family protein
MSTLERSILVATCMVSSFAQAQTYNLGRTPTAREIAGWNIDVTPDGVGLPRGSGTVKQGGEIFVSQCSGCHGAKGEGGVADRLVGGIGSLTSDKALKTVGSFWPYATTLYDYIYRAMPYTSPQSLTPNQLYAVTAYILYLNGIVSADATLDATSLPKVRMPNSDGFRPDPRPDTSNTACLTDCD